MRAITGAGWRRATVAPAATPARNATSSRNLLSRLPGTPSSRILDRDGDPELLQLGKLDRRRRPGHRIHPGLVLRERERVPDERLVEQRHRHAVDARGDPAVRRRAHRERVEQEAELRAL